MLPDRKIIPHIKDNVCVTTLEKQGSGCLLAFHISVKLLKNHLFHSLPALGKHTAMSDFAIYFSKLVCGADETRRRQHRIKQKKSARVLDSLSQKLNTHLTLYKGKVNCSSTLMRLALLFLVLSEENAALGGCHFCVQSLFCFCFFVFLFTST